MNPCPLPAHHLPSPPQMLPTPSWRIKRPKCPGAAAYPGGLQNAESVKYFPLLYFHCLSCQPIIQMQHIHSLPPLLRSCIPCISLSLSPADFSCMTDETMLGSRQPTQEELDEPPTVMSAADQLRRRLLKTTNFDMDSFESDEVLPRWRSNVFMNS